MSCFSPFKPYVALAFVLAFASPIASNASEFKKAGLDTAEKMSVYYTKALAEILTETGLYIPFEGGNLRSTARVLKKMGLTRERKYIVERSKTHFEQWTGKIALGSYGTGAVTVEISGCGKGSRKLGYYSYRVSGLDKSEMASLKSLFRKYPDAYSNAAPRLMHHASREEYATGKDPIIGSMITVTATLDPTRKVSEAGQLRGSMSMECP